MFSKRLLLVICLGLASCTKSVDSAKSPGTSVADEKPIATVSATEIFKEFSGRPEVAAGKYNDKLVEVYGKVKQKTSPEGEPITVELIVDESSQTKSILCSFDDKQRATLTGINSGESVKIKGICKRHSFSHIFFENCVLVEPKK